MRALATTTRPVQPSQAAAPEQRRSLLWASRLILPVAFFGYGIWANLDIFTRSDDRFQATGSVIRGEVTEGLTRAYARAMPHREPAVAWIGAARYLLAGEGREGVLVGEDGWLFTEEEAVFASNDQIRRVVEEVQTAQERLAAVDARLVVVPVPAKADIQREEGPDERMALMMEVQHERFMGALREAGIEAADVRPALLEVAGAGQAFLRRDTHWTPTGATAVAEALAGTGLVPLGSESFTRRDGPPVEVQGDLVSFVTSEPVAQRLGLGPERVTPFVAEASGLATNDIFAAEAPSIGTVLVGTSYSADDRWGFAAALSLALGRDVLNLAEKGQGPVRPMRALLADLLPAGDAPEYVIWEFPVRYLADPQIWPDDTAAGAASAQEGNE